MHQLHTLFSIIATFVRTHYQRLLSMSAIFALVVMLIVLVQQVISNLDRQINEQTRPIVGADMIVSSSQQISGLIVNQVRDFVAEYDGVVLQQVEFYTTIQTPQEPILVQVKGVESGYPLYDGVRLEQFDNTSSLTGAYVDPGTYDQIGNVESVMVGETQFALVGLIQNQQSVSFSLVDQGKSIIIPYEMVSETQLTDFGSRVGYELLIKLDDEDALDQLKTQLESSDDTDIRVSLAGDRVQQLGSIVDQVNQYISIILIVTVVLSLLIMSTATMTMSWKITHSIAVMKVLGLTRVMVAIVMVVLYGSMFVIGSVVGWYIAQRGVGYVGQSLGQTLVWDPSVGWTVVVVAVTSFVIACWQPIRQMVMTPALQLLRNHQEQESVSGGVLSSVVLTIGSMVILWELTHNLWFSVIIVAISVIMIVIGRWFLYKTFVGGFGRASRLRKSSFGWWDVIRSTTLAGNQTGLLVGGVSIVLVCYAIITSVSVSFVQRLRVDTGDQANIFVLNIKDDDLPVIETIEPNAEVFDIILARVQSINQVSLSDYLESIGQGTGEQFSREFNVTSISLDDEITEGRIVEAGGVSLDVGFAQDLGVGLGDMVTLSVQGREFELEVVGLRTTERTGAAPFFYIQVDAQEFADAPKTWFRTSSQSDIAGFKLQVVDKLGTSVSFIDVGSIVEIVRDIATTVISIIIICMSIVILLIMSVSIANNEASALISRRSYRLYHMMGMTKSDLMMKIWRTIGLYTVIIVIILVVIVPLILVIIFASTSLFSRSASSLIPVIGGIMLSLGLIVGSYVLFHRRIVAGVLESIHEEE